MIEATIVVKTQMKEYAFSSIIVTTNGIIGTDAQSQKQMPEIPLYKIQSMVPYQKEVCGVICMN